jgi:hypothetical protein
MYRIPPAIGKTAGQKVQCKIAVAVQKVKTFVLFIPLFWNLRKILSTIILVVSNWQRRRDGGFRGEGIRDGEIGEGEIQEGGCEGTLHC